MQMYNHKDMSFKNKRNIDRVVWKYFLEQHPDELKKQAQYMRFYFSTYASVVYTKYSRIDGLFTSV